MSHNVAVVKLYAAVDGVVDVVSTLTAGSGAGGRRLLPRRRRASESPEGRAFSLWGIVTNSICEAMFRCTDPSSRIYLFLFLYATVPFSGNGGNIQVALF